MTTATFRFYARLNHFLDRGHRGQAFETCCAENASLKHMIEALGVPHTEVALVLINGMPGSLDALIGEEDRIAVYPKFETLDLCALTGLAAHPPGAPRFVADSHLGALARLLRMAGFDTLYDNCYEDAALAELANREDRVLLTRDRELLKRRMVRFGCFVHATRPRAQLRELYDRLDLQKTMRPFTLCLTCNTALRAVDKREVIERLPQKVRALHEHFLICDSCNGIFWEGTHWENMRGVLDGLAVRFSRDE